MWVYPTIQVQNSDAPEQGGALLPAALPPSSPPAPSPREAPVPAETSPCKPEQPKAKKARRRSQSATVDCCLLAAAFLLGTAAAGSLQALCDTGQADVLQHYLQCWQELFSVPDLQRAGGLFCAEYAALAAAATALLLLGLSAVGPICIFLTAMLYGLGNGLLSVQLLSGADWKHRIGCVLLFGAPVACAAGGLCLFGAAALQVSARIRAYSFRHQSGQAGAKDLLGQYVLAMVAFLPLCGAATALACLGGKLLW